MLVDISKETGVQEAIDNLSKADAGLQLAMMDQARDDLAGTWTQLLNEQIAGRQDYAGIVQGSSVVVGATGFGVYAAQSTTPLSGGLIPYVQWQGIEFGARTRRKTIDTHSRKGTPYKVTKMINRGLPNRQPRGRGRVGFRAASEMGTALVGVWVDVMVSLYRDAVGDDSRG